MRKNAYTQKNLILLKNKTDMQRKLEGSWLKCYEKTKMMKLDWMNHIQYKQIDQ